jgi:Oligosaccharyltransferase subunit Ribophorin II
MMNMAHKFLTLALLLGTVLSQLTPQNT